jgi:hypothetical protein
MMHPTDRQLVDHVTRRPAPEEADGILLHLAGCAGCRLRADQLAALYPALGTWEVPPASRDFEHGIMAAVEEEDRGRKKQWEYARVAAAIVLALGLGHLAARGLCKSLVEPPAVDAATAAETVGLDVLAGSDSGDLDVVLQLAQVEGGLQ